MTTPTSFALSSNISACDTLTFANGMNASAPKLSATTMNLLGQPTSGYVLPDGVIGYLLGAYEATTNVFTVGTGSQTLFWNGTADEFSSVGTTGGNWQLAT
jgi:hypothetical protein